MSDLGGNVKDGWRNLKTSFNNYKRKQVTATGLSADEAPKQWKFFSQIAAFLLTAPTFAQDRYVYLMISLLNYLFSDRISNVEEPSASPSRSENYVESQSLETIQIPSSASPAQSSISSPSQTQASSIQTPGNSISQAQESSSQKSAKKRTQKARKRPKHYDSDDDDIKEAIIKSLGNSNEVGPLARMVDETEQEIKKDGSKLYEIEFSQEIMAVIYKYRKLSVD